MAKNMKQGSTSLAMWEMQMKSPFYIQQTGKEEDVCPCGEREKGGEDVTAWNPHDTINGDINGHHCFGVDLGTQVQDALIHSSLTPLYSTYNCEH